MSLAVLLLRPFEHRDRLTPRISTTTLGGFSQTTVSRRFGALQGALIGRVVADFVPSPRWRPGANTVLVEIPETPFAARSLGASTTNWQVITDCWTAMLQLHEHVPVLRYAKSIW